MSNLYEYLFYKLIDMGRHTYSLHNINHDTYLSIGDVLILFIE